MSLESMLFLAFLAFCGWLEMKRRQTESPEEKQVRAVAMKTTVSLVAKAMKKLGGM